MMEYIALFPDERAVAGARQDWDVMILHYLGLDHAGHLGGEDSPTMRAKQAPRVAGLMS